VSSQIQQDGLETAPGHRGRHPDSTASSLPDLSTKAVGYLLPQLGFETARRFKSAMTEIGLVPRQFDLLRAIETFEAPTQNAVADWLRIPPSSMVALVDQLEERDLVVRRTHPTDRRSRILCLTARGKKLLASAARPAKALEAMICVGFTAGERQKLLDMLIRVSGNLDLVEGPDSTSRSNRTPE
jgi:DNA-binding MarR family transcriptional regulator